MKKLGYQKIGKNIEALNDMKKSLSLNDKYTKGYLRRGHIHMALENWEFARIDYAKVVELEPSKKFYLIIKINKKFI